MTAQSEMQLHVVGRATEVEGSHEQDLTEVASASLRYAPHILLTTPSSSRHGGVSQYWHILRTHLPEEVQYFTIGSRSEDEGIGTLLRLVRDSVRFANTLRHGQFDLVHLNPSMFSKALVRDGLLLLIAKAFGKPVLVFVHGWNPGWDIRFPTFLPPFFRVVYARADAFVVLGRGFKEQLQCLGIKRRIFIERAPIADEVLEMSNKPFRTDGAAKSAFNILFLARVERDKGIYEALDTFAILKQRNRSVSLTVAGDGSELDSARQYARTRNLDDVSFVGYVDGANKTKALRFANAYLLPSHHEGLPLSVLEAMAFGIPVVACRVGALREFFEDGKMGFASTDRRPEVLASLLDRLMCDPSLCADIRVFNQNYARANFTAGEMGNRFKKIYRLLLGGGIETESVYQK